MKRLSNELLNQAITNLTEDVKELKKNDYEKEDVNLVRGEDNET